MSKKVLLVCATFPLTESSTKLMAESPPSNLLYLATFLKNELKAEVRIIDGSICIDRKELYDKVNQSLKWTDCVGFTLYDGTEEIAYPLIAETSKSALTFVGGWPVTLKGKKILEECDAHIAIKGVKGEALETLKDVVSIEAKLENLERIEGIIFRKGKEIIETKDRKNILYLPELEWKIERFGLDWNDYVYPNSKLEKLKKVLSEEERELLLKEEQRIEIPLYMSFTCPNYLFREGCIFCDMSFELKEQRNSENFPMFIKKIHSKEKERIRNELKNLKSLKKPLFISFNVDACTYELWKLLIDSIREFDLNVSKIVTETRVDLLTDAWLEDARNEKIRTYFQIGFEFGNDEDLSFVNKNINSKMNYDLIHKLKDYPEWTGFFILSSPITNNELLLKNISVVEEAIKNNGKIVTVNPVMIPRYDEKKVYFKRVKEIAGKTIKKPLFYEFKSNKEEILRMIETLKKKISEHENNEKYAPLQHAEKILLKYLEIQLSRLY
jgi:radical SAM superfamily enzyme YgiQ (UPF0313 family)